MAPRALSRESPEQGRGQGSEAQALAALEQVCGSQALEVQVRWFLCGLAGGRGCCCEGGSGPGRGLVWGWASSLREPCGFLLKGRELPALAPGTWLRTATPRARKEAVRSGFCLEGHRMPAFWGGEGASGQQGRV